MTKWMQHRRRAALLAAALLATAACGSSFSESELATAAGVSATRSADQASSGTGGDTSTDGFDVGSGDPIDTTGGTDGGTGQAVTTGGTSGGTGGTGGTGSTGGTGGTGGQSSGPATGTPIVIGVLGSWSGVVGNSLGAGKTAVQAWAQDLNARGGINGHPIKLEIADDGADPARHRQLAQSLVEERGVQAFVYMAATLSGFAATSYFEQKSIPVVGSEGAGEWFNTSKMFFPQVTHGVPLMTSFLRSVADVAIPRNLKKFGYISCNEAQFCQDSVNVWPKLATNLGFTNVYHAAGSLAQPSFTAECLGGKQAGAEVFYVVFDANSITRAVRDCAAVGYKPLFAFVSAVQNDKMRTDPNLDGAVVGNPSVPWFFTQNPEIAKFNETYKRLIPGAVPDGASVNGWLSARLLETALRKASDPTKSAGILEGLYASNGETLNGTIGPVKFNRGAPATPVICWSPVVIKDGQYTSPVNGKLSCQ